MPEHSVHIRLPDPLENWPWARKLNPDYLEISKASEGWVESFYPFSETAQRAFNACNFGLLASLAYPLADKARLRTSCDLMNFFFLFDEYSDLEDEDAIRKLAAIVMDAFNNPQRARPEGECLVGEMARQFWQRSVPLTELPCQKRFLKTFASYLDSVIEQGRDRACGAIRSIDDYFYVRRRTIGCEPSFAILAMALNIPDSVFDHPSIYSLSEWCIYMISLTNDMCSYDIEQARGDDSHNIISVVMHALGLDVHGAYQWVADYYATLVAQFLDMMDKIPSWGEPIDNQVAEYVYGIANWVRANDSWHFEGHRYFGCNGLRVKEHRSVILQPKLPRSI